MSREGRHTRGTMGEADLKLMGFGFFEKEHIARATSANCIQQ
jgi:hypothetical protein